MTRQVALVFFGSYRGHEENLLRPLHARHSHSSESSHDRTKPRRHDRSLIILAGFAILLGFSARPLAWFDGYLTGEEFKFDFSKLTEPARLA